jgi:two-component system phosphate regulon sensor histidine kinase PhoR
MKPSTRLVVTTLLVVLTVILLFWAVDSFRWKGPALLLAGAFLSLGLIGLLRAEGPPGPSSMVLEKEQGAEPTLPPAPEDKRDVYIPGRNFEEMLERLGSNESMLNVILNSMGEGVLLLNQADRIVLMNPTAEKILGTTEKENIGRHYLEIVRHPALADLLARSKREGLSSGEMDFSSGKDDKIFAASVAAIRVERDHLLGQIVVLSDITSIKRLMRMRTEFAANVSHELKTPLTAILGYVETLISGAIDDKKNRGQFLQKISDQAHRLNALITDVLELSRIESGMYISALESIELSEVAQQAVELLKAKVEAKEIILKQEIPAGTRVMAHREGVFHILENLLDNAVKYSPRNSEVRVGSAAREDGQVEFSVEDHGLGIPPEAQARVFERFFRVDVSRSREAGGTGLGLAIVKHLVEKMNGEISLKSEEGKGSTFTVVLAGVSQ